MGNTHTSKPNKNLSKLAISRSKGVPPPNLQEVLKHPLYEFDSDDVLSLFTGASKLVLSLQILDLDFNPLWKEFFQHIIFEHRNIQHYIPQEALFEPPKTLCGKHLSMDDLYFRCLDCDLEKRANLHSLQCIECFEKSNHKGHRVIRVKKRSRGAATCDCGFTDRWKSEGFCPDHKPQNLDFKEMLPKFPAVLFERFQMVIRKSFYGVFALFEIGTKLEDEQSSKLMISLGSRLLDAILSFCEEAYEEKSGFFKLILAEIFRSKFLSPYNRTLHNCTEYIAEIYPVYDKEGNSHPCECSIISNLLIYGQVIEAEQQMKLEKILIECCTDLKFKNFLAMEVTKAALHLYCFEFKNQEYHPEDVLNSKLLRMAVQIFDDEATLIETIEQGYFYNFLKVMEIAIEKSQRLGMDTLNVLFSVRSILCMYINKENPKLSRKLLQEMNITERFMNLLLLLQTGFFFDGKLGIGTHDHEIDYMYLDSMIGNEKTVTVLVESCVLIATNFAEEEKNAFFGRFFKSWFDKFQMTTLAAQVNFYESVVTFNVGFERLLASILLANFGANVTPQNISDFLGGFITDISVDTLAEQTTQGILKCIGMIRFLQRVHCFNNLTNLWGYLFLWSGVFETDIVSIQLFSMMIKPEKLFKHITTNFFSYDTNLQEFFNNPASLSHTDPQLKKKLSVLEDFLHFLIFIMNDENCLLNLFFRFEELFERKFDKDTENLGRRVNRRIAVNFLLGFFWTELSLVTATLEQFYLQANHRFLKEVVSQITLYNEKSHKIRIKDEYQTEFDPYTFYKAPAIQQHLTSEFTSKMKKDDKVDLVGGVFYKDVSEQVKSTRNNFFQSELPDFLSRFLKEYTNLTAPLVRPVLKLVLLNLQVAAELQADAHKDQEALKRKIESVYMTEEFNNVLNQLLQNSAFKDCKLCIEKIKTLLNTLSSVDSSEKAAENILEKAEDEESKKKQLAQERMRKMKEQFSKKQNQFADKHKDMLAQEDLEESKSSSPELRNNQNDFYCQHCREPINKETDNYGIPVYIGFTNNFYDTTEEVKFEVQNYSNLLEASWWPVISSCQHPYHRKCFGLLYQNTRSNPQLDAIIFGNEHECYCSLCKTLCNNFLPIRGSGDEKKSEEATLEAILAAKKFTETTDKLFKDKIAKITDKAQVNGTPVEAEIFKRAAHYFIESFHMETEAAALQTKFELYANFLRCFSPSSLSRELKAVPDEGLFFASILEVGLGKKENEVQKLRPEGVLNKVFIQEWIESSLKSQSTTIGKLGVPAVFTQILKEYLRFKTVQYISLEKHASPLKVKDCFSFYKQNEEFKNILFEELRFPLQKIALAYNLACALNQTSLPQISHLCRLVCGLDDGLSYLDQLIQEIDSSLTFETLLETALIEAGGNHLKESFYDSMLALPSSSLPKPKASRMAPRSIDIPEQYSVFNVKYISQKCDVCKQYTPHLLASLCLICDKILCCSVCDGEGGSLNRHCKQYHMGSGIFIDIIEFTKQVISSPMNSLYSERFLYIDKFGQRISMMEAESEDIRDIDFTIYKLEKDYAKKLKSEINNLEMARDCFRVSFLDNQVLQPDFL